ncbi:hypothetical protein Glove_756g36 [Diversispora epigaea]|uniref:Uncharacterized protein n=1 Tax=Diversispora epigaea TaxID=1348612 RepID=A0A397G7S4_9GLOM|nr:hypothetical protein Glove_756g36 [Diversispora epigaea]
MGNHVPNDDDNNNNNNTLMQITNRIPNDRQIIQKSTVITDFRAITNQVQSNDSIVNQVQHNGDGANMPV